MLGVGPHREKKHMAESKIPLKFSQEWLIECIVCEISLSGGGCTRRVHYPAFEHGDI